VQRSPRHAFRGHVSQVAFPSLFFPLPFFPSPSDTHVAVLSQMMKHLKSLTSDNPYYRAWQRQQEDEARCVLIVFFVVEFVSRV
jgi:hypothetical protein